MTLVTNQLEALELELERGIQQGTRLTWEHSGFTGFGGFAVSRLLASVRRKMLQRGLPSVLDALKSRID